MKEDRIMTIVGVLTIIMGLLSISTGNFIIGGVILLLAFGIFWNRGGGKFNDRSPYEKIVRTDMTVAELFEKLRDLETPLGKPWIAKHKGFDGDSIVFGPNTFRDTVVISRKKNYLDIKHITLTDNIIRDGKDEYRFRGFIDPKETEVTPKRYSIFASFKLASMMMVLHLTELTEKIAADRSTPVPGAMDIFGFSYHNSLDGWFRNGDDDRILKVENAYSPFTARVLDDEGNEMASVSPRAYNGKGVVIDSAGYDLYADGEHFGEIRRTTVKGVDKFTAETGSGTFTVTLYPACRRANVACNYLIEKDGELKAVIGGSPNIVFEDVKSTQNDVILSYDDDYLVLYAILEIFILTLNKKFLK